MREQIQHDRADGPGPAIEFNLAEFLLGTVDAVEEQAEELAERDISRALGLKQHPGDVALKDLTDRLMTRCAGLAEGVEGIPAAERGARGAGALETWAQLKKDGPADGPLGSWSYTKHLALAARDMVRTLREHRAAAFVGRADLPPIAPDAQ
jgi:cytochrome P450